MQNKIVWGHIINKIVFQLTHKFILSRHTFSPRVKKLIAICPDDMLAFNDRGLINSAGMACWNYWGHWDNQPLSIAVEFWSPYLKMDVCIMELCSNVWSDRFLGWQDRVMKWYWVNCVIYLLEFRSTTMNLKENLAKF